MLSDFYDSATSQLDLFGENRLFANGEALMGVMDRINRSGRGNYGLRAGHRQRLDDAAGVIVTILSH